MTTRRPSVLHRATRADRTVPGRAQARGIALLLVLGVLAGVTIMTAAALTSQQNAPASGQNAIAEVQARWSAESAAGIAAAILETNADYAGGNADLLKDLLIAQGLANVKLTNLNGDPPTEQDRELVLTATATVSGVSREITKRISVTPQVPIEEAADPYYSEFGIVATNALVIEADAVVKPWPASPDAATANPVAIGAFTSSGAKVSIDPAADVGSAALFVGANADVTLSSKPASPNLTPYGAKLPYELPLAPELPPAAFSTLPWKASLDISLWHPSHSTTIAAGGKYKDLHMANAVVVTLDASKGTHYSFDDITLTNNAALVIKGVVAVEVRDRLDLDDDSGIVLADANSAVAFFVSGNVEIEDSGIGVPMSVAFTSSRSVKSLTSYSRPDRVRIFGQGSLSNLKSLQIKDKSLVVATIHAPYSDLVIHNSSLVGRASARDTHICAGALYYDPKLDHRSGFTNLKGPLYAANGAPNPSVVTALTGFVPDAGVKTLASLLSNITPAPTLSAVSDIDDDDDDAPTPRNHRTIKVAAIEAGVALSASTN